MTYRLGYSDPAPHPTIQAITAPLSSRSRGNWGLKRDIPHKVTHSTLRYTALDTQERFMTFESANDDVLTLKKWQEMDVPLTKGLSASSGGSVPPGGGYIDRPKESVFGDLVADKYKWRYSGPFLMEMTARDFKRYVELKIKPRKEEFLAFVAEQQKLEKHGAYGGKDTVGSAVGLDGAAREDATKVEEPKEQQQKPEIDTQALRADIMALEKYITKFLDIPQLTRPHHTHPSAGLHYSRSKAHLQNHPKLGLVPSKSVPGRSLNFAISSGPLVGAGGIVAVLRDGGPYGASKVHSDRTVVKDYEPVSAYINSRGRIVLELRLAVPSEEQVFGSGGANSLTWGETGERLRDDMKKMVPNPFDLWSEVGEKTTTPGGRGGRRAKGLGAPQANFADGGFFKFGNARPTSSPDQVLEALLPPTRNKP